jgi:hypothetical protein
MFDAIRLCGAYECWQVALKANVVHHEVELLGLWDERIVMPVVGVDEYTMSSTAQRQYLASNERFRQRGKLVRT